MQNSLSVREYFIHKEMSTPQDPHRALGIGLLQGPGGGRFISDFELGGKGKFINVQTRPLSRQRGNSHDTKGTGTQPLGPLGSSSSQHPELVL